MPLKYPMMVIAMAAKFKLVLAAIGAILIAILTAFFKGRNYGAETVRQEVERREAELEKEVVTEQVKEIKRVNKIQQEVLAKPDSMVDKELYDKWSR